MQYDVTWIDAVSGDRGEAGSLSVTDNAILWDIKKGAKSKSAAPIMAPDNLSWDLIGLKKFKAHKKMFTFEAGRSSNTPGTFHFSLPKAKESADLFKIINYRLNEDPDVAKKLLEPSLMPKHDDRQVLRHSAAHAERVTAPAPPVLAAAAAGDAYDSHALNTSTPSQAPARSAPAASSAGYEESSPIKPPEGRGLKPSALTSVYGGAGSVMEDYNPERHVPAGAGTSAASGKPAIVRPQYVAGAPTEDGSGDEDFEDFELVRPWGRRLSVVDGGGRV